MKNARIKKLSLILFCCVASVLTSIHAEAAKPNAENCDYYLDKEKETGCFVREQKDSAYLVRYGYKYCSIFKNKLTDWKDERKDWVQKTAKCLQSEVEKSIQPIDCVKLEDDAFDSHPGCYRKSGFCELKPGQKTSIVWTAIGSDTVSSPGKSLYQGFALLGQCLKGLPPETSALYSRSVELVKLDPSLKLSLERAFEVDRLDEKSQLIYSKKFFELLISNNRNVNPSAYTAYSAIYGSTNKPFVGFQDLKNRCFNEKGALPEFCKDAEQTAGSKLAFKSLKNVPSRIDHETIDKIIKLKSQLESMK